MNSELINSESNTFQIFNKSLIFFKIFLRKVYLLPYLLIFAYEALKTIEISKFNLWEVIILYFIALTLFYFIPLIILHYLEKKHYRKVYLDIEVKCSLCNRIVEPNFKVFQKTFYVPFCDYHINLYRKSSAGFIKAEKKKNYRYNNSIFGISLLIVLIGVIFLSVAGVMSGIVEINALIGKLQILIIFFTLFPIQLFTHIFFTFKIVNVIKRIFITKIN